jgi:hypothetical protein
MTQEARKMPKSRNDTQTNQTTQEGAFTQATGVFPKDATFKMFGPMRKQTVRDVTPVCRECFPGRLLYANAETIERLKGLDMDDVLENRLVPANQIWVLLLPIDIKPVRRTANDRHES